MMSMTRKRPELSEKARKSNSKSLNFHSFDLVKEEKRTENLMSKHQKELFFSQQSV